MPAATLRPDRCRALTGGWIALLGPACLVAGDLPASLRGRREERRWLEAVSAGS